MAAPFSVNDVGVQAPTVRPATEPLVGHFDVEDILGELLDRICSVLEVDTAAVLLLDDSSAHLVLTAARGVEETVRRGVRVPVTPGFFAERIASEKRPVIVEQVDDRSVDNPVLRQYGIQSLMGVPLLTDGTVLGVLHVGTLTTRVFTPDDVRLLQVVAERVALAIRVRLLEIDQASALQSSLLPASLPVWPGLELAARYRPAGDGGGVGGDWYDVFSLPSGWLGLVIGDVVGRGLQAAVVMGRLRSALRAYAFDGDLPSVVLDRLDRDTKHFEPGLMATVLYATLEPSGEQLHLSTAGHPLPVLAAPGRPARVIDVAIDPPLGVRGSPGRRTSTVGIPIGAVACFYTDGLIERRTSSLDSGIERLRQSVTPMAAESLCTKVMHRLIGDDEPGDDAAVLAIRRLADGVS